MLNDLAERIHNTAVQKGFWEYERSVGEVLMLIVSEASEALEEYRDGRPLDFEYLDNNNKPAGVPSEMADIIIRVLDACAAWNIDIDDAVRSKIEYNKTRPQLHDRVH